MVIAYGTNLFDWSDDEKSHMVPEDANGVREALENWVVNDFDEPVNQQDEDWLLFCGIMGTKKVFDLIDWEYVRNEILKELEKEECPHCVGEENVS